MKEVSGQIFADLTERNGHIYVCGDVSMAEDVNKTLKAIFVENGVADCESAIFSLKVRSIDSEGTVKGAFIDDVTFYSHCFLSLIFRRTCVTTKTSSASLCERPRSPPVAATMPW